MSILSKMKRAVGSKANAALDKALDPEKEIELLIAQLEKQRGEAVAELINFKAASNKMDGDVQALADDAARWEKRAALAVKKGDDEMAKDCLRRKKQCQAEQTQIKRDQLEAAGYANELNRSRKQVEQRLRMLKLKKGTLAAQLRSARGKGDAFSNSAQLFEKLERAERDIDEEAIEVEVAAELDSAQSADQELETAFLKAGDEPAATSSEEDPLALLKARMEKDGKLLKK